MQKARKIFENGFSIIELLVVVTIIGIVTAMMIFAYGGVQSKVFDSGVEADVERMATLQTGYKYSHSVSGKAYYSGDGPDTELNFTAKSGNVIDVVVNSNDYCVRGYNSKGTKNAIDNAFTKESNPGACSQIAASAQAISDSLGTPFWVNVTSGQNHACALTTTGKVYCWGSGGVGQLGNNSTSDSQVAVQVDDTGVLNGLTIDDLSTMGQHSCVLASNNQIYCWGYNGNGELGNNSTNNSSVPVSVYNAGILGGKTIKSISVGYDHTCAIANNRAYCWGSNAYGQLGTGDTISSSVPKAVTTVGALNGKSIKYIMAGGSHTCVTTTEDKTYCWGMNMYGQLGDNSTTQRNSPVYVDTTGVLSGKTIVSMAGYMHTCAVASDGKAYCWGYNSSGQLGDNSTTQRNSPVAVVSTGALSGKTVRSVSVNENNTCAIASDNKAYCWGSNGYGQLGDNSTNASLVPVAVVSSGELSGKSLSSVASGWYHSCGFTSDNNIYCWGRNNFGQFGNNTLNNSLTPTISLAPPS